MGNWAIVFWGLVGRSRYTFWWEIGRSHVCEGDWAIAFFVRG
ncbi:MAG: hypothetical protein ACKPCM_08955 [Pseudanabaena sp.]